MLRKICLMNKLQDFTISTNFCNCFILPCETPRVIEPFSFFEETEKFKIYGGTSIFFLIDIVNIPKILESFLTNSFAIFNTLLVAISLFLAIKHKIIVKGSS